MDQAGFEEVERMMRQLDMEYEQLHDRLQAIWNYHNAKFLPGKVRAAAVRRAENMKTFAEQMIAELNKKEQA